MHSSIKISKTVILRKEISIIIGKESKIMDYCVIGVENPWDIFNNKYQKNIKIGAKCIIYPWSIIYEGAFIEDNVQIFERSTVGSLSVIGKSCRILYGGQVHDKVTIGNSTTIGGFISDNCNIGNNCFVYGSLIHKHDNRDPAKWDEIDEIGPILEDNVFVGWGAVLIGAIRIGKGASIAPNSIVTRDLKPGEEYGRS
jgi:acetyltransferase-like isoleucine patch superfamily enzyme